MEPGDLIAWKKGSWCAYKGKYTTKDIIGILLHFGGDNFELLELKTFKGEVILAPRSECSLWSCPTNPGCHCGACHP